jgi:pimeloyl-ACP methyl ester carboxylesterase
MGPTEDLVLSERGPSFHFLHANGYPPEAYQELLKSITSVYSVSLSYLRPFWPGSSPDDLENWTLLRDDYLEKIFKSSGPDSALISGGHSLGGTVSLLAALKAPEFFRALVLIEPVIFTPLRTVIYRTFYHLQLIETLLPLIRRTRRRKGEFHSTAEMYKNYRSKSVFENIPDSILGDYVRGLAYPQDGGAVGLRYPPEWEARIYQTSGSVDLLIWRTIPGLQCPVLILRGGKSRTLTRRSLQKLDRRSDQITAKTIQEGGHLLPFEHPEQTSRIMLDYLAQQFSP